MVYLDTSALVKRYIAEPGSQLVQHILQRHRPVGISRIAYVEAHAAFARLKNEKVLSRGDFESAAGAFDSDRDAFTWIEVRAEVVVSAKNLAVTHGLRTLDALHLASALEFRQRVGRVDFFFVAADRKLLSAARGVDLQTIDVEK